MTSKWFSVTKSISSAVALINGIEVNKLAKLCQRVISTMHIKDKRAFSIDEEEKLQGTFDLNGQEVESVLDTIAFILEQAIYHNAKATTVFAQQLSGIGMIDEKVECFVSIWADNAPSVLEHFRKQSIAPRQLEKINWQLNLQVAQANKIKLKVPTATMELVLNDASKQKKLLLDFKHDELFGFFKELERIQVQLDALT